MRERARSADLRGDTIAAVATAPGRGALAVIRVSGSGAQEIARRIGALPAHDGDPAAPQRARQARRVTLHECDAPDEALDDALATYFPAPHSATGEDVIELSLHGGRYVSGAVMAALVHAGARPALAGEFTERAVRNGKMDLLQAEAVADLIDARSRAMHRTALRQLSGALSHRLEALRSALLDVDALIAYEIDFPDEDDGPQPRARTTEAASRALAEVDALVATLPVAELGRDGLTVVLAGAPNAGKSSLLNALVGERRAIVSEVPGTTRDAIDVLMDDDPWPLRLVDTAGLRASDDLVERLGVEVSEQRVGGAHMVLVCGESDGALEAACAAVSGLTAAPLVAVRTKCDLLEGNGPWEPTPGLAARAAASVAVSATTGAGLAGLRATIRAVMRSLVPDPTEQLPPVTRARHVTSLRAARAEIEAFRAAWMQEQLPVPVAATHLRAAVHQLDELLGGIDVDEVLERVFRSFCIGK
ncbi:MAG: tRNA uridine-5-carboxymethylaminomethyl(34) synthesis GTPase MnmE [Gemmatimonadaceae bacterium]